MNFLTTLVSSSFRSQTIVKVQLRTTNLGEACLRLEPETWLSVSQGEEWWKCVGWHNVCLRCTTLSCVLHGTILFQPNTELAIENQFDAILVWVSTQTQQFIGGQACFNARRGDFTLFDFTEHQLKSLANSKATGHHTKSFAPLAYRPNPQLIRFRFMHCVEWRWHWRADWWNCNDAQFCYV